MDRLKALSTEEGSLEAARSLDLYVVTPVLDKVYALTTNDSCVSDNEVTLVEELRIPKPEVFVFKAAESFSMWAATLHASAVIDVNGDDDDSKVVAASASALKRRRYRLDNSTGCSSARFLEVVLRQCLMELISTMDPENKIGCHLACPNVSGSSSAMHWPARCFCDKVTLPFSASVKELWHKHSIPRYLKLSHSMDLGTTEKSLDTHVFF